jgi:hypothetical protein
VIGGELGECVVSALQIVGVVVMKKGRFLIRLGALLAPTKFFGGDVEHLAERR